MADWLASLELAPKTKSHIRNLFHLLFQWACRRELTDRNPIKLVRQSNRRLNDPRVLTPEEFKALLAELEEPYRTMVVVPKRTVGSTVVMRIPRGSGPPLAAE